MACLVAFLLTVTFGVRADDTASSPAAKPNVLWILEDACRAGRLTCMGYARPTTPALDALAARGVLFEQNYAQAAHTVRSTPTYITGRYFPVHCLAIRTINWNELGKVPPDDEKMAPDIFRENGYRTHLVTTSPWIIPGTRLWEAFEHPVLVAGKDARPYAELEALTPHILEAFDDADERPFFIHVHAMDTHTPHYRDAEQAPWFPDSDYETKPEAPFDAREQAWLAAQYDSSLVYADRGIAQILAALEARGLAENTLVVFSSDHGELLGEDGRSLLHPSGGYTDEQLHTPLIMAGPGLPEGTCIDAFTENVDILPTLCVLAKTKTPARFDGRSVLPLLAGEDPVPWRSFAFSRIGTVSPWFVLTGREVKYFGEKRNGKGSLFARPDRLGERRPVQRPERLAQAVHLVRSQYRPRYDAYMALPFIAPPVFHIRLSKFEFREIAGVVRHRHDASDGQWSFYDKALLGFPESEDLPKVRVALDVPNGRWTIAMSLQEYDPARGGLKPTVLRMEIEGAPQSLVPDLDVAEKRAAAARHADWYWVSAGVHEVRDGKLDLAFEAYGPTHLAGLRWLKFTRAEATKAPVSRDHEADTEADLKALGYL